MGIHDRDYMRPGYRRRRAGGKRLPLKARLAFLLWKVKKAFSGKG
jgi:hypothetical protein